MFMLKLAALSLILPFFALSAPSPSQPDHTPLQHPLNAPVAPMLTHWNVSILSNSSFHTGYHRFSEATAFLESLAREYPQLVALEHVGYSAEGREIVAAAIARPQLRKKKGDLKKKPRFVLTGAQHAREWIATSTALYLSHALVTDGNDAGSITRLLDLFDFYIVPIPNPDGYEYTWDGDRFWYKNRMPVQGDTVCRGVDMNRNWGFHWAPSSPNQGPCEVWYPGTRPYQAPEVNALANYFGRLERIRMFVDLRSYGQMVSTPYSYSCDDVPPDAEDVLELAHGAAAALYNVHGTIMTTGMLCETLYSAPGNIVDWMYAMNDVKYSYAVHLRDTGTYGFALPAQWIKPVGEETAGMASYMANFVSRELKRKRA